MDISQIPIPTPTLYPTPSGLNIEIEYDDTAILYDGAKYYINLYNGMDEQGGYMTTLQGGMIIIILLIGIGLVLEQLRKNS
jgi:hypothetical protein